MQQSQATWLSIILYILTLIVWYAVLSRRKGSWLSPAIMATVGVFVSSFVFLMPCMMQSESSAVFTPGMMPELFYRVLRMYIADFEYSFITGLSYGEKLWFYILAVTAFGTTLTAIISVFRDFAGSIYLRVYTLGRRLGLIQLYVFNEINERSVQLAESLHTQKGSHRIKFIFTDAYLRHTEAEDELAERIRKLRGLSFKENAVQLDKRIRRTERTPLWQGCVTRYILCGMNEAENLSHALQIGDRDYRGNHRIKLSVFAEGEANGHIIEGINRKAYARMGADPLPAVLQAKADKIFATYEKDQAEGYELIDRTAAELLHSAKSRFPVIARRIDPIYSIARQTVHTVTDGLIQAHQQEGHRKLSFLIIGLGKHGMETLKALLWFLALPQDLDITISIFDRLDDIDQRVYAACPGLHPKRRLFPGIGGNIRLNFINNSQKETPHIELDSCAFDEQFATDPALSHIDASFICMGNDDINIETAVRLRTIFRRLGRSNKEAEIYTTVYDSCHSENMANDICTYTDEDYDIHFVGAIGDVYNYNELIAERSDIDGKVVDLESLAFKYHIRWTLCDTQKSIEDRKLAFYNNVKDYVFYEYFRRSSVAKACHKLLLSKHYPALSAASLYDDDATEQSRATEHQRWCAYTVTLGYVGGDTRDHIGKIHPDLRAYDDLSPAKKQMDD